MRFASLKKNGPRSNFAMCQLSIEVPSPSCGEHEASFHLRNAEPENISPPYVDCMANFLCDDNVLPFQHCPQPNTSVLPPLVSSSPLRVFPVASCKLRAPLTFLEGTFNRDVSVLGQTVSNCILKNMSSVSFRTAEWTTLSVEKDLSQHQMSNNPAVHILSSIDDARIPPRLDFFQRPEHTICEDRFGISYFTIPQILRSQLRVFDLHASEALQVLASPELRESCSRELSRATRMNAFYFGEAEFHNSVSGILFLPQKISDRPFSSELRKVATLLHSSRCQFRTHWEIKTLAAFDHGSLRNKCQNGARRHCKLLVTHPVRRTFSRLKRGSIPARPLRFHFAPLEISDEHIPRFCSAPEVTKEVAVKQIAVTPNLTHLTLIALCFPVVPSLSECGIRSNVEAIVSDSDGSKIIEWYRREVFEAYSVKKATRMAMAIARVIRVLCSTSSFFLASIEAVQPAIDAFCEEICFTRSKTHAVATLQFATLKSLCKFARVLACTMPSHSNLEMPLFTFWVQDAAHEALVVKAGFIADSNANICVRHILCFDQSTKVSGVNIVFGCIHCPPLLVHSDHTHSSLEGSRWIILSEPLFSPCPPLRAHCCYTEPMLVTSSDTARNSNLCSGASFDAFLELANARRELATDAHIRTIEHAIDVPLNELLVLLRGCWQRFASSIIPLFRSQSQTSDCLKYDFEALSHAIEQLFLKDFRHANYVLVSLTSFIDKSLALFGDRKSFSVNTQFNKDICESLKILVTSLSSLLSLGIRDACGGAGIIYDGSLLMRSARQNVLQLREKIEKYIPSVLRSVSLSFAKAALSTRSWQALSHNLLRRTDDDNILHGFRGTRFVSSIIEHFALGDGNGAAAHRAKNILLFVNTMRFPLNCYQCTIQRAALMLLQGTAFQSLKCSFESSSQIPVREIEGRKVLHASVGSIRVAVACSEYLSSGEHNESVLSSLLDTFGGLLCCWELHYGLADSSHAACFQYLECLNRISQRTNPPVIKILPHPQ